ncbi:heme-binding domain-containing protein [Chryseobacterium binzhouense]|uniref:heme-binding domain-containing protein n=1 Tax=Chryseobacterium binzhouense TaxID=2593646 RepID=UPI001180658B|nr:heme-binding domain-containing protein [Chryseobacterium binzhouense]MXS71396.1 cytochrome C [Flavobacteriaceae bacterium W22]
MNKTIKIIFWVIVCLIVIQLIPVDKENLPVKKSENFTDVQKTPENITSLLKNACYDCHSNETQYPGYAYIAPFSWSVKSHINEGREHLNFSVWNTYNDDLKKGMLEKSIQTIENKSMPMPAYIIYHNEANLTDVEKTLLKNYFQEILNSRSY